MAHVDSNEVPITVTALAWATNLEPADDTITLQTTVDPDYDLTWEEPAERVDGSGIEPIAQYHIEWGETDIGALATANLEPTVFGYSIPNQEAGKTYRARISATDDQGRKSQLSGFVYFVGA